MENSAIQSQAPFADNYNRGLVAYSTIATGIVAVLLLTNWPSYRYLIYGGFDLIWFHLLPGLLMIPVVFAQPALAFRFFKDPLLWWLAIYVMTGVLWLLFAQDFIEAAGTQWRTRLLAFGLFFTITILSAEANRRVLVWVVVGTVLFACASTWFDVLRPYRFVPQGHEFALSGRGAGFFVNPNVAASFIAAATIVSLPFLPMRFRALFVISAVVGIVPTFSRSGFLYAGLILVGAGVLKILNRGQMLLIVTAIPLLVGATMASYDFLMTSSDDANLHNVVKRLEWFQGEEEDEAARLRKYGAAQAWKLFTEQPITGNGVGITTLETVVGEGPHNMYLMLMAEQGIIGLALYPALVLILARRGRRLAQAATDVESRDVGNAMLLYAGFLFAYGFFSHNVLEEPQSMFIMAFIAAAVASARRQDTWAEVSQRDFQPQRSVHAVRPRLGRL